MVITTTWLLLLSASAAVQAPAAREPLEPDEETESYQHVLDALPAPGEWALLPGSEMTSPPLVSRAEFPNCGEWGGCKGEKAFLSWTGMAWDESHGLWWQLAGGGHRDYGGNEIYRFSFGESEWRRITEPQPLTGVDLGNGCRAPAVGPPASHTNDGVIYIPRTKEALIFFRSPFCKKNMPGGRYAWAWSVSDQRWRELTDLADAGIQSFRYPKTALDEERGVLYALLGEELVTLSISSPEYRVVSIDKGFYSSTGSAFFDPETRYFYWTNAGDGLYRRRIGSVGSLGERQRLLAFSKEQGGPSQEELSLALHRPSGDLVQWEGGPIVYRIEPSGKREALEPSAGAEPPPRTTKRGRIYSKWIYLERHDVFMGLNDARDGIWLYRLPESAP